jgi:hypothetical protein
LRAHRALPVERDGPSWLVISWRGEKPRALAAFVKRPQAALLKSALQLFYKTLIDCGQTNVFIFFIAI